MDQPWGCGSPDIGTDIYCAGGHGGLGQRGWAVEIQRLQRELCDKHLENLRRRVFLLKQQWCDGHQLLD